MCHSQIFLINIFSKIEKKIEKSEFLSIALIYVVSKYILTYSRNFYNNSHEIKILLEDFLKINNNSHYNKNSVGKISKN